MTARHLRGLNPPQLEAVRRTSGPQLVLAGAGTGKTRVVTSRIAEILAKGVPPAAVCAVTFTNKAAREMRTRVEALLQRGKVDDMVVSTFHSLGLRILREFGEEVGGGRKANVADEGDQLSILEEGLREVGISRKALPPRDAKFRIGMWKNAGLTAERVQGEPLDPLDTRLAMAWQRYDEELRRRRLLDFDDLILLPLELLQRSESVCLQIQDRWRYLLVDEYQDTNGAQFRLVKLMAGERQNICVVGDDDQSIYGWRGAEADRILRFTQDMPSAKVVTLEQNYRSTNGILQAAHALIQNNAARRPKELWSALGAGEKVRLYVASDEKDELDHLIARLAALKASGDFKWEEVAILFRANSQCRPLEQALRSREFPYRVIGTRSFFDRREVRDLLAFLRLANSPRDDSAFHRIINVPPRGVGKGSVDRVAQRAADDRTSLYETIRAKPELVSAPARRGFEALDRALEELRNAPDFGAGLESFVESIGYRDHLRNTIDEPVELDMRLKVVDELIETARQPGPDGERDLAAYLDALSLREDNSARNNRGDKEPEDAITLITMHAAKGLEYPYVFIVGLEDGIVPHAKSIAAAEDESSGDDLTVLEEERRLLYVAMTRAMRRLTMSYCRERTRFGRAALAQPSRFIEEIGEDLLEWATAGDDTPADEETGKEWLKKIRSKFDDQTSWEDW